ncbi:hypothetical protein EVAR_83632_1 [Eumeta japonica]|uniref:Uncharacterized protein n=1 Tax=Eumeta variegata TaxID=151549 RepID=A0A4C1UNH8_EUMVA|nr:hypothetical protein EVAR_83632_1 [Eumeta japonica]
MAELRQRHRSAQTIPKPSVQEVVEIHDGGERIIREKVIPQTRVNNRPYDVKVEERGRRRSPTSPTPSAATEDIDAKLFFRKIINRTNCLFKSLDSLRLLCRMPAIDSGIASLDVTRGGSEVTP